MCGKIRKVLQGFMSFSGLQFYGVTLLLKYKIIIKRSITSLIIDFLL